MVNLIGVGYQLPPQPTPFVGRWDELSRIAELMADPVCRLLTLVGPGGIGKTRLALEAAATLADNSSQSIYFVPLQSIASADLIVTVIREAVGLQFSSEVEPKEELFHYLSRKTLLLILDNFEHLLDGAGMISELLVRAPGVKVLLTSRERLNIREEWVFEVGGLTFPKGNVSVRLEDYSAVELFVQNAQRVHSNFSLIDEAEAVVRICSLVDGTPLALELAASWVRALSCAELVEEIQRSLDILETSMRNVEPRHRTMRAAFQPTWQRLTGKEQDVFKKLSVFRGGFTREAAEGVAGGSLRTLSALVDRSLLRRDASSRYDLHELLRQYGEERLNESGISEAAHAAHSLYYADFLRERVEDLKGRRQLDALAEIAANFENACAAWNWAVVHKDVTCIDKMMEGLWLYCDLQNRYIESKSLFRNAERQFAGDLHPEHRQLWGRLVARAFYEDEPDQAPLETALQIARHYGNLAEIAYCLEKFHSTAFHNRDYSKARQLGEQSLKFYRQIGDFYGAARVLYSLQSVSNLQEGWSGFNRFGVEAYHLRRTIGDWIGAAWALAAVAHGEARVGHHLEAERLWLERIGLGEKVNAWGLVALGHAHLSYSVYFIQGDFAKSRTSAEKTLNIALEGGISHAAKWGLVTLALLANMEEGYQESKNLCQQAISEHGLPWTDDLVVFSRCLADCGLSDYQAVRESFPTLLICVENIPGLSGLVLCLPIEAILLAHEDDPIGAVELLALAFTHPAHASGWMEKWPLLTRLRIDLEQRLGSEAYAAAWERGILLDLDTVAASLREQFPIKPSVVEVPAHPPFANPLTERELEILRLVADGLSNRQIAERLVLATSTVKWYVNQIFSKLDVSNRIQAVAHARSVGLLS